MAVTILAIAFLALVGFVAFIGYKTVIRRDPSDTMIKNSERCAICRQRFEKHLLVERQIGDYKLLYFCDTCILSLYGDLGRKN